MDNNLRVLISYVTSTPHQGDKPKVYLVGGDLEEMYRVEFIDYDTGKIVSGYYTKTNTLTTGGFQWFINWEVKIYRHKDNVLVYSEKYNPTNKVVFIKFDGRALGDNIAWIPYVEEFRKKHNCTVICSTFQNDIFKNIYPNILFVNPNTVIENVYSQYYVGASIKNIKYCPIDWDSSNLQLLASKTLGLEHKELRPLLEHNVSNTKPTIEGKYVCISEFASTDKKHWKCSGGWQRLVDSLVSRGLKVVVVSKEPTKLTGVIDLTQNDSLIEVMATIYHSRYYIGLSSGLSWLAWALGKKVVMISDVTPSWCEFKSNNHRVIKNKIDFVDYDVVDHSSVEDVMQKIDSM